MNDCFTITDIEVDPKTIGQFTGLKEIYERDIVEVTRMCVYEKGIIISKDGCYFIKSQNTLLPLYQCAINDFKLKVIGNIHDNKNLLESEEKQC